MSVCMLEARSEGRTEGNPDIQSPGTGRLEAAEAEALLRQWEPLVRRLASRWGNAAEREDLEQVARIALWQAARRFDPARGCSFRSFAVPTIEGALLRHLRDRAGTVRVPRSWWELYSRLQREAETATQELGRAPRDVELADRLGLPEEVVARALGARELCHPRSLDEPRETPAHDETEPLAATIGTVDPRLESVELRVMVRQAVARLPERLREVIEQRYFAGMSQKAVGRRLGISQVHVSRLEQWALVRLQTELRQSDEPAPDGAAGERWMKAPQDRGAAHRSAPLHRRARPAMVQ